MKKIFIILLCMITLNVSATEMCARNDTVVIPLDATIGYNGFGNNATEWLWWLTYSYGVLYGSGTCLSKKEVMMYSDWNGSGNPTAGLALNIASDELLGLSGYYMNANVNSDIPDAEKSDYARIYCFYKLTHPMSSSWIYSTIYQAPLTGYNCKDICVKENNAYFKATATFNSIGTIPPWTE